jgi:hypothetical protein
MTKCFYPSSKWKSHHKTGIGKNRWKSLWVL